MRYTCIDTAEFVYPDITEYQSGSQDIRILAVRGSYACAQILFSDADTTALSVKATGWSPEIYEMVAIPVECNLDIDETNATPHMPEREAPYEVYDCIKPCDGTLYPDANGVCAVYFSEWIAKDAVVGVRKASVTVGNITIPVTVEVSPVVVPDETLSVIMGYSRDRVCTYHHVEANTPTFEELDTAYLQALRRMHQNMLYCPAPKAVALGNNRYDISFDAMEAFFTKTTALGFNKFTFVLGRRRSWSESTIYVNDLPAMSFECYCYLAQMLPAMVNWLRAHGWLDKFILCVSDEPNEANGTEYRALCGLIRKLAPELKLMDATSFGPIHGAIDIWVPKNDEYLRHKDDFEVFRSFGDDVWYYNCNFPRGNGIISRFMDYPLLATRYHFWANYRYGLTGYLHWACNHYQPGQDPFRQSCPEHRNADLVCRLPAGDTHILYPGEGAPWLSVRLEAHRASAEEYEMFRALDKIDHEKAYAICTSVCREFNDVDYDPNQFREARTALIRALEATLQ